MNLNTTCPWCSKNNELQSQVARPGDEHQDPKPGDFTMCMHCGAFAVFTDNRELRRPTRAEVAEIGHDAACRAMRLAWRDMHSPQ